MTHRRLTTIGFALTAFAVIVSSRVHAAENARETERDLIKLEREWDNAIVQRNATVLRQILAKEYVLTTPYGQLVNRDQMLESLRIPRPDAFELKTAEHSDVSARLYGDTAVLHSRFTLKGRAGGEEVTSLFRQTDVFVMRDGQWRCVTRQATLIAVPDAPAPVQTVQRN